MIVWKEGGNEVETSFPLPAKIGVKIRGKRAGRGRRRYGIVREEEESFEIGGIMYRRVKAKFLVNFTLREIDVVYEVKGAKRFGRVSELEEVIFITDKNGVVVYLSPSFDRNVKKWAKEEGIKNYKLRKDIIGKYKLWEYMRGEEREKVRRLIEGGKAKTMIREVNVSPREARLLECKQQSMTHVVSINKAEDDLFIQVHINLSPLSHRAWRELERFRAKDSPKPFKENSRGESKPFFPFSISPAPLPLAPAIDSDASTPMLLIPLALLAFGSREPMEDRWGKEWREDPMGHGESYVSKGIGGGSVRRVEEKGGAMVVEEKERLEVYPMAKINADISINPIKVFQPLSQTISSMVSSIVDSVSQVAKMGERIGEFVMERVGSMEEIKERERIEATHIGLGVERVDKSSPANLTQELRYVEKGERTQAFNHQTLGVECKSSQSNESYGSKSARDEERKEERKVEEVMRLNERKEKKEVVVVITKGQGESRFVSVHSLPLEWMNR